MTRKCDFCGREADVRPYAVQSDIGIRRGEWCATCRDTWLVFDRRKPHDHHVISDDWEGGDPDGWKGGNQLPDGKE